MVLSQILRRNLIKTDLQALSKMEAIEELVDLLVEAGSIPIPLREHVLEVVAARERTLSTGMEYGVALPHGSTDRISEVVGALGISHQGIPFDSRDGLPAQILVLLVLPKQKLQAHVRTLASVAHLMSGAAFRKALVDASDSDAIVCLLKQAEDSTGLAESSPSGGSLPA